MSLQKHRGKRWQGEGGGECGQSKSFLVKANACEYAYFQEHQVKEVERDLAQH